MSERKHELTDADLRELADHDYYGKPIDFLLSSLPSRRPADPDAGLGKLPWRLSKGAGVEMRYERVEDAAGVQIASVWKPGEGERYDPAAVASAILAAPEGYKLARMVFNRPEVSTVEDERTRMNAIIDLAASFLAIAEGREQ